ncbi:MAG TPA: AMP-binding protein [Bryobacteraceae bacterium]|nr:AMP-binding protein [Bryobacteraceae bacterium]
MIELLQTHNEDLPAIANCAGEGVIRYGQLILRVAQAAEYLRSHAARGMIVHACTNTADSIVLYLACLEAGCPVLLLDSTARDSLYRVIQSYRPEVVLLPPAVDAVPRAMSEHSFPGTDYRISHLLSQESVQPHADLALLLTTSGSTGTPKLVRLTLRNVLSNARSIIAYLGLEPGERSIQGLPMHYSYGLSLINSHLLCGGTVVLTPHSFITPEFWSDFDRTRSTSFAGVPYMYDALNRVRFDPAAHPSLRTMTQAGGGLRRDLIASYEQSAAAAGIRFFVMYGQTEATARIAYVPPERLRQKVGSIGIPVPGGHMQMAPVEDFDSCELVYSGPNVMMGYAESAPDLARGDEMNGVLHTGDLVQCDAEGFFYIVGRLNRFAKLFGRRFSLSDIENELETTFRIRTAVIDDSQRLRIFVEEGGIIDLASLSGHVARSLRVPPKFISVDTIPTIPLTSTGKKDYRALSS